MRNITFATPIYRQGEQAQAYCDFMNTVTKAVEARGWKWDAAYVHGNCYVQQARNTLAGRFLDGDGTDLFFVDDDVAADPESAIILIESPYGVAFGAYPKKADHELYPVVIEERDGHPVTKAGWVSCKLAPTGFMRIKREVLENLASAHPELKYKDYDGTGKFCGYRHDFFPQGVRNGIWWGEDYAFCNLWKEHGGDIMCWPDIDFRHYTGGKAWTGNFHRYLLNRVESRRTEIAGVT